MGTGGGLGPGITHASKWFLYSMHFPLDNRKACFISVTNLWTNGNDLCYCSAHYIDAVGDACHVHRISTQWLYAFSERLSHVCRAVTDEHHHIFKLSTIRGKSFPYDLADCNSTYLFRECYTHSHSKTLFGDALTNSSFTTDFALLSVVSSTAIEAEALLNIFLRAGGWQNILSSRGTSSRLVSPPHQCPSPNVLQYLRLEILGNSWQREERPLFFADTGMHVRTHVHKWKDTQVNDLARIVDTSWLPEHCFPKALLQNDFSF